MAFGAAEAWRASLLDESAVRILHIDDDRDFSDLFVLIFGQWFNVTSVPDQNLSWEKILDLLTEQYFDAIITDFDIPGINGLQLMEKIRSHFPALPVIFLTGQGNEEIAREAFLAGASDYFTKDLFGFAQKEKLINSINRVISTKKTEEAHRESERKYRALINNSPDLVMRFDREMRFKFVNGVTCRYTGLDKESIMGKTMEELGFPVDICSFFKEKIKGVFNDAKPVQGQIQFASTLGDVVLHLILAPELLLDDMVGSVICTGRDITKMTQAQKALEKSEERLKNALDASSEGMWELDTVTGEVYFSPYYYKMLGYTPGEIEFGLDECIEMIHPEDRERIKSHLENIDKISFNDFVNEYRIANKDGEYRWMMSRGRVVSRNINGCAERIVGTNTDVTQRRLAQEMLDRERAVLNNIIELSPYTVGVFNREGRMVRANNSFRKLFGISELPQEYSLFEDETLLRNGFTPYFEEILKGNAVAFPGVIYGPNKYAGNIPEHGLYLDAVGFPIRDIQGEVEFIVIMHQDNTSQRLAEEALQQANNLLEWRVEERTSELAEANRNLLIEINMRKKAQEMLRSQRNFAQSLIETAQAIILVMDYRGRIVQFNRYMEELSGRTEEDVCGKQWEEVFFKDSHRDRIRRFFEEALNGDEVISFSSPIVTADGQIRQVEWNLRHLRYHAEKTSGVIAVGQDVTDRLSAENDLRRRDLNYQLLVEAVPVGICQLDTSGGIVFANERMKMLIPCKNRRLEGMNIMDGLREIGRHEEFAGFFRSILENDGNTSDTFQICIPSNGAERKFSLQWTLRRNSLDEIDGVILIVSDDELQ